MLENIRGHSRGSIPPLRMPSLLPHDLCHEWNVSRRLPASPLLQAPIALYSLPIMNKSSFFICHKTCTHRVCVLGPGGTLAYCSVSLAQCLVHKKHLVNFLLGFPGGSGVKNVPANAGDAGSIPGLGRSSGEGNGNLLQCSCCEIPNNRGAWRATEPGVAKESDMT